MLIWRVIAGIALLIIIAIIVTLKKKKYLKAVYMISFRLDRLIKKQEIKGKKINKLDLLFVPNINIKKYINEYILSIEKNKVTFVAHYYEKMNNITYYLSCFNEDRHLLSIHEIEDTKPQEHSKIIYLTKHCKFINIEIKKVNDVMINPTIIKPIEKKNINKFVSRTTMLLLCTLVVTRQIILEILGGEFLAIHAMDTKMLAINYGSILFISLVYRIIVNIILKKKNGYTRKRKVKGGKVNDKL